LKQENHTLTVENNALTDLVQSLQKESPKYSRLSARSKLTIYDLNLDNRTRNALKQANLIDVADICNKTETEILAVEHLGLTSLAVLRAALDQYGLRLLNPAAKGSLVCLERN